MKSKIIWTLLILTINSELFCQPEFVLQFTDSSALNLLVDRTTEKQIIDDYSEYFSKQPKTDTIIALSCVDCDKGKYLIYETTYYIRYFSLNIICLTSDTISGDKPLRNITLIANTPTRTNLGNFVVGQTTVKEVENKFHSSTEKSSWGIKPWYGFSSDHLYLEKDNHEKVFFGTKNNSIKPSKNSVVDMLLIITKL